MPCTPSVAWELGFCVCWKKRLEGWGLNQGIGCDGGGGVVGGVGRDGCRMWTRFLDVVGWILRRGGVPSQPSLLLAVGLTRRTVEVEVEEGQGQGPRLNDVAVGSAKASERAGVG